MKIDFCHYTLKISNGDSVQDISESWIDQAPRGAHRHRQDDLVGMLITIREDHRYQTEDINDLAASAIATFFKQQGSVTRAIQVCFDEVNKKILERNLDRGYEGIRADGSINMVVMHQGSLFVGQAGETYTLVLGKANYFQWGEPAEKGTTLGSSKRFPIKFFQSEIQQNDLIILSPGLPSSWNAQNLAGSTGLSMGNIKRRLVNQVTMPLKVVLIQIREGRGRCIPCSWDLEGESTPQEEQLKILNHSADESNVPEEIVDDERQKVENSLPEPVEVSNLAAQEKATYKNDIEQHEIIEPVIEVGAGEIPVMEGQMEEPDSSFSGARTYKQPSGLLISLAHGWMAIKAFGENLQKTFYPILKIFNNQTNPRFSAARDALRLILAVAIPVILVLASNIVYSQSGKKEQHQLYLQEAQSLTELALNEKNMQQQRDYWIQALDYATRAEEYDSTQESRFVFNQARTILDEMDLVKRLDFRPALTQYFPDGVIISQIQASSSGVFLLDSTSGNLLRIFLNSKGFYELDQEFSCAPGPYGLTNVSNLVDFVMLPANKDNYKILAMDGSGNLLYCRPGNPPVSRTLPEPEGGWKKIIGAAYDQDILYVLDADRDTVWMYQGKDPDRPELTGIVFSEAPVNFFDSDIPDLGGAMDLSVNQEELYILHQDGHMTVCQYSPLKEVKQTECKDPFAYTDNRVGHEKNPLIFMGARLGMLQQVRLPNGALYLLEYNSRSIFQFSFQLNLEQTLKVQPNKNYPVPDSPPSGFGISPEQDVFLAYDNQLFVAPLR